MFVNLMVDTWLFCCGFVRFLVCVFYFGFGATAVILGVAVDVYCCTFNWIPV